MPKMYFPFFEASKVSSFIHFLFFLILPFSVFVNDLSSIQLSLCLMAWRGLLHMMESFRFKIHPPPTSLEGKVNSLYVLGVNECEERFFFVCVLHIMFLTPRGATINCRASFTRSHNRSKMRIWRQIASQSPWVRLLGLMRRGALILNSSSTKLFLH